MAKNVLTTKCMFKLCTWIKANETKLRGMTQGAAAVLATSSLGFPVTVANMRCTEEATGVLIGRDPPSAMDGAVARLATEIIRIGDYLGIPVSDELMNIAGDRTRPGPALAALRVIASQTEELGK